jgi:hypothetical protein
MSQINCAPFGVYSFANTVLTIDGRRVIGFGEGDDVISIEPTTELGTSIVGADGSALLSITADQSATLTLKLVHHSPFNDFLWNKVKRMRLGETGPGIMFAIGFSDPSTGDGGGCTQAVVKTVPTLTAGANATEREWAIFCPCWVPDKTLYA